MVYTMVDFVYELSTRTNIVFYLYVLYETGRESSFESSWVSDDVVMCDNRTPSIPGASDNQVSAPAKVITNCTIQLCLSKNINNFLSIKLQFLIKIDWLRQ